MNKKLTLFITIILISKNIFGDVLLSEPEKNNAINLNHDFSFNIPVINHVNPDGMTSYYNVNFIFVPRNNKLLFEVANVVEIDSSKISIEEIDKSVTLNRDFSFNVLALKYEARNKSNHFYHANFILAPKNNKLIFQAVDVIERFYSNNRTPVILYEAEQSLLPKKTTGACSNRVDIKTRTSMIREGHYSLTSLNDKNISSSLMSYCEDNIDNNG